MGAHNELEQQDNLVMEGFDDSLKPNPNHVPIQWSTSRADTAECCKYKYYKVYICKDVQSTHALVLGSLVHDVLAIELDAIDGIDKLSSEQKKELGEEGLTKLANDFVLSKENEEIMYTKEALVKKIQAILDKKRAPEEAYTMLPNMVKFIQSYRGMRLNSLKKNASLDFKVENKYGITSDYKCTTFFAKDVFIRLVVDMWAYDAESKKIVVIDHKTNKSAGNVDYVKNSEQLNLYCWALMHMFDLDVEVAEVALHFVRHGKIVWAKITKQELLDFGVRYQKKLHRLDHEISCCENSNEWPRNVSFHCNWCPYKVTDCKKVVEARKKQKENAEN